MKIAVFSSKSYDRHSLERYNASFNHELTFFEPRLSADTVALARGFPGICIFVNDACDATVIDDLARHGTTLIATRSAGYNQIDLAAAARHGVTVGQDIAPFASRRLKPGGRRHAPGWSIESPYFRTSRGNHVLLSIR